MNDYRPTPQYDEQSQSIDIKSESIAVTNINKPKKSTGLKILIIILILVLLAGNVISVFLLIRKGNNTNTIADIDLNDEYIDDVFNGANLFDTEGLFPVKIDGRYGYINKNGAIVISPQFHEAYDFIGGLAKVCVDDKYGIIRADGKYIVSPQYDEMYYYSCGLCAVKLGDNFGYIDRTGKVVIPIIYREADTMSVDGYAIVLTENKERAIINTKGKVIYSYDYSANLCREVDCYESVYGDDEYCYDHEKTECSWSSCEKEATYGDYCFTHYYALED